MVCLLIFGVLWTPFAALICGRIARAKSLRVGSYVGAGAGYSALFFLPWIYLVARMLGRNPPSVLIRASYVLIYACWLALTGGYAVYYFTELYLFDAHGLERYGWEKAIGLAVIMFVVVALNLLTWTASVLALRRAHAEHRMKSGDAPREILPGGVYIYPFALLLAWVMAFPLVWAITYGYLSP